MSQCVPSKGRKQFYSEAGVASLNYRSKRCNPIDSISRRDILNPFMVAIRFCSMRLRRTDNTSLGMIQDVS